MKDTAALGKPAAELLVEVRRRREEVAEARLSGAGKARHAEEVEQTRLLGQADTARRRLDEGRRTAFGAPPVRAAHALARDYYLGRLDAEAAGAEAAAAHHRAGPLARAVAAEQSAQKAYVEARREREVAERHQTTVATAARRLAERRADAAADDLTGARITAAKLRGGR